VALIFADLRRSIASKAEKNHCRTGVATNVWLQRVAVGSHFTCLQKVGVWYWRMPDGKGSVVSGALGVKWV